MNLHISSLCCLLKGNPIQHSIIWEIFKNVHCIYLYIYLYFWVNPCIWRVELGLGRRHGAIACCSWACHSLLAHDEFIVSVWLNQRMRIRGWKRISHATFNCFLYHLYFFNTTFNSLNIFTMYIIVFIIKWRRVKMCYSLLRLCPFASFLCFKRITSFLLQFSFESDERLPLWRHAFFFLLNVWLPHFMYTGYIPPQVQYPVMFCWVFLSCLVGESIIRDGVIHLTSSKGY